MIKSRVWLTVLFCVVAVANLARAELLCEVGVLTEATLAGDNPATGQPWQEGDPYRLVFISSERVLNNLSSAISDWNEEAQRLADNAVGHDLSHVVWKIVGSTADVNARDNTATNPDVHGAGHAIFLMDGSTLVAANFIELWSGEIQHIIDRTENAGQHVSDSNGSQWPLTGSNASGMTSHPYLRDHGDIRQGQADHLQGWIDRANYTVTARTDNNHSIYVMSEPLAILAPIASMIVIK